MRQIFALGTISLNLIGLYLLLRNAGGATRILGELSRGTVDIFRTLQGR